MTTRLIIARHGNTFTKDQTPTRVGGRTDLPLVESERGRNIGKYLKLKDMLPDVVFAAPAETDDGNRPSGRGGDEAAAGSAGGGLFSRGGLRPG